MAALNFPNSPIDGQQFAAGNGLTYVYNLAKTRWDSANTAGALPANSVGIAQLSFPYSGRNILINSNFHVDAAINQRVFAGGQPADNVYGFDRWKGSSGATMITQVVRAGNYVPSTTYTLSGINVTTQQIVSPASGEWNIEVATNADLIQLEIGDSASSYEYRSKEAVLSQCRAYFFKNSPASFSLQTFLFFSNDTQRMCNFYFPNEMVAVPTVSNVVSNVGTPSALTVYAQGIKFRVLDLLDNQSVSITSFEADAEFY